MNIVINLTQEEEAAARHRWIDPEASLRELIRQSLRECVAGIDADALKEIEGDDTITAIPKDVSARVAHLLQKPGYEVAAARVARDVAERAAVGASQTAEKTARA